MATLYPRRRAELARPRSVDNDGDKIGTIEEIYLDRETDEPEWARRHHRPVRHQATSCRSRDAQPPSDGVRVPFEKATVKDAPNIDPDGAALARGGADALPATTAASTDYDEGSGVLDASDDTRSGATTRQPTSARATSAAARLATPAARTPTTR